MGRFGNERDDQYAGQPPIVMEMVEGEALKQRSQ
jgi:hypothetical protein